LCDPIAFGRHLRQIGHVGSLKQKPFASWHIIYKNKSIARTKKQERMRGMARAVHWDSERDVAEDGQYMHASPFCCASQIYNWPIYNWPKGADAAALRPSYNSKLQRSR
jgi:hypothetical protein